MSGNQVVCYCMFGGVKQCFYIVLFDNFIVRYYCYVICQMCYNVYIMGYQQYFWCLFLYNVFQQIEDVCLCYYVKVGGWFIGDDKW